MLDFKEEYKKITNSKEYKEFEKENQIRLSSIFLDKETWQFNFFYGKKTITFYFEDNKLKEQKSELYSEDKNVEELDIDKISISLNDALEKINKILNKSKEKVNKKIIIIQQKDIPFWNITYITNNMNVMNIKINATNGEIIEKNIENIMKFKSK